ncbi:sigma-70 family RNA polymerase sigma factor, partial [Streptomyces sp. NPDC000410]|uniref:RNA polymerase sigma factor n=1 Tax=Streptomyces sp. NPDC000410 TaxID=3154254 RepID=UPI0033268F1A
MSTQHEAAMITAAQAGDPQARDRLVAAYLPLVHNIVGRALNGHADVDRVVQETMLRMLGGLGGLRSPESFRGRLAAVAMDEIRGHWWEQRDAYEVAGPGTDFVDLTITRLGLSGQRREVAEATRWLDQDDRALLSLWWLEAAGELSRAEVAAALELSPQHTAVKVQWMTAHLETARVVARALSAAPRCALLEPIAADWDGVPSAPWRNRLAWHTRDCTVCLGHLSGLAPAEGLLAGLALVPMAPAGPASSPKPVATASARTPAAARALARRQRTQRRRRATAVAATVAALVTGGGVVLTGSPAEAEPRSEAASWPFVPDPYAFEELMPYFMESIPDTDDKGGPYPGPSAGMEDPWQDADADKPKQHSHKPKQDSQKQDWHKPKQHSKKPKQDWDKQDSHKPKQETDKPSTHRPKHDSHKPSTHKPKHDSHK